MSLPPEMLARPAAEGARAVVLALLAEAGARAVRVGDPGDGEALHDLRVALRRVRVTLRGWRDVLGPAVRDKDLRRLRRAARATGAARDAEVLVAWLDRASARMAPSPRRAARWLREWYAARTSSDELVSEAERIAREAGRLSRRLHRADAGSGGPAFDAALASRVRAHAAAVEEALGRVEPAADLAAAHRARIEGKRLRYLVEPLRGIPGLGADDAVRALRGFQDRLGELNDARVAREAVGEAVGKAARRTARPGARRGAGAAGPSAAAPRPADLAALEAVAARRVHRLFARLRREVLRSSGADVLAPALAVAAALEARARERGARERGAPSRRRRGAATRDATLRGAAAGRAPGARRG